MCVVEGEEEEEEEEETEATFTSFMVFAEKEEEEESWWLEVLSPPAPLPCPAQDFEFPLNFFRLGWIRERKSFPDAILKFVSFFAKHLGVPFKKRSLLLLFTQ